VPTDEQRAAIETEAAALQRSLDLTSGPIWRAVLFDRGADAAQRLLIVVHHLAVDGVSWRILLPDLEAAHTDAAAGRPVRLAPVPTPFARWARALAAEAGRPERAGEMPLWTRVLSSGAPLPTQRPLDPRRDVGATARDVTIRLSPERTAPLLTWVPASFAGTVNDVLLTALALAVADVHHRDGAADREPGRGVVVALESHGRHDELGGDLDLSRTVGWCTNVVPVALDPGAIDLAEALSGGPATGEAVRRTQAALRAVPGGGLGYGLLRHLDPTAGPALAALPAPPIQFNYLGRFGYPEATDWSYAPEADDLDIGADPAMPTSYHLTVDAQTEDRPEGPDLSATWTWPDGALAEATVHDLAATWQRALDALTAHADERRRRDQA
jgi:non-ribosomal peptide synthase protein (TIGR01720 family)